MNPKRQDLLSIGNFAHASQLSLKALRLYAQLGILKPSYIDPESGYRYYHTDQLREARLIRMMRQMDMPLATIRQVIAAPADAEKLVCAYLDTLEMCVEQARRIVRDLVAHLRQEEPSMTLEVSVRTVDPQPVIRIKRHVIVDHLGEHIQNSLQPFS